MLSHESYYSKPFCENAWPAFWQSCMKPMHVSSLALNTETDADVFLWMKNILKM